MPGFGVIGQFALGEGPQIAAPVSVNIDSWAYSWSTPVRFRPSLRASARAAFFPNPTPVVPFGWFESLTEPVRFRKDLGAARQFFFAIDVDLVPPASDLIQWFSWFSEPVRVRLSLKVANQQFLAYHPRMLPTPDITMVWDSTEVNTDAAIFALNVYDSAGGSGSVSAHVSVIEVPIEDDAAMSIRE